MIKINLCPVDELESPFWYVPDVMACLVMAALAYFGGQYHLGLLEADILSLQAETAAKQEAYARLKPDLERFKDLNADIERLNAKVTALRSITVSKVSRYKPVIAAEHLHNLKPEGVWYKRLELGTEAGPNAFKLSGSAFDGLLVAELMTALRSTESGEFDSADLRTQVHFANLSLVQTGIADPDGLFPELVNSTSFEIQGQFLERATPPLPAPAPVAGKSILKPVASGSNEELRKRSF